MSARSPRLPGLEALRLIAAVCVLLLHVRANYGGRFIFGSGYLGVDFFLMLSGFLMARTTEPKLAAGLSPLAFLKARYKRLWPTMAAGSALGLPLLFATVHPWPVALGVAVANMLLLPVWGQRDVFPLNIPAWTIFYELAANAAHVLGLWRLKGPALVAALVLAGLAVRAIALQNNGLDVGARVSTFWLGAPRILFAYMLGMALARWWRDGAPRFVPPALALVAMPALLPLAWWLRWQGATFDLVFVMLVCPLMIAGAMRLQRGAALCGWAGRLAFPLFAYQMPVLQGLRLWHVGYWNGLMAAALVGLLGAIVPAQWRRWRQARAAATPAGALPV